MQKPAGRVSCPRLERQTGDTLHVTIRWITVVAIGAGLATAVRLNSRVTSGAMADHPPVGAATPAYTVTADTVLAIGTAGNPLRERIRLATATSLAFAVGTEDIRIPGSEDPNPLSLGPATTAFVWVSNEPAFTHPFAVGEHDSRVVRDARTMTYLSAHVLMADAETSERDTPSPEWAFVTVEPGNGCRVRFDADGAVMLFDLGERDARTFFLRARETPGCELPVPAGQRAIWIVRRAVGATYRLSSAVDPNAVALPPWRRIVYDDGEADSHWGQVVGTSGALSKTLDVNVDPATLHDARIVYHMSIEPFDDGTRAYAGTPAAAGAVWSSLVVHVNGHRVYAAPLDEAARQGWHWVRVPLNVLTRGDNDIRFSNDGGDGYYLSIDLDTARDRSAAVERGTVNRQTLRPFKSEGPGEYMVRMEIR